MFERWSRRSLVGVDLGHETIKVVEVQAKAPAEFKVWGLGSAPTPEGGLERGRVRDAQKLADSLRQALAQGKIKQRRAALAVPAHQGFVRRLSFPHMPLKELRSSIELQAERYIPFAHDGAVFDLFQLPAGAGDSEMSVVLAAAPRSVVEGLMETARQAGLVPERVDLAPLALLRAGSAAGQAQPDSVVGLVDLGRSTASIALFEAGVPTVTRVLDMPDVQDEQRAHGTEEIFWDIRRSLEFALTQLEEPPSRVLVTGGVGGDDHLALSLSAYLRSFLSNRLPGDFAVEPLRDPEDRVPASHMLALGLSLPPELFTR